MKTKKYEMWLIVAYIAMLILFFRLNFAGETPDRWNLVISGGLFVIAGTIFYFAIFKSFRRTNIIVNNLEAASDKIQEDYKKQNSYLWEIYRSGGNLFSDSILAAQYNDFHLEMIRLEKLSPEGFHCDIEDYINYALIDSSINRSLLNLVPGIMTGLGILGTFIGLSIGLQNFNTGTADEISESVAPLMGGIKVAFHTSIYGMVFSLVFNFVYKKKIEVANNAMDRFLTSFESYVCPKANNDGMNRILNYQDSQSKMMMAALNNLGKSIAENIAATLTPDLEKLTLTTDSILKVANTFEKQAGETLNEVLSPTFDKMNNTIEKFVNVASNSQIEGMNEIVDKFITSMDSSLGDRFEELGKVLAETSELQQEHIEYMQNILQGIGNMSHDLSYINETSENVIQQVVGYLERLNQLQNVLNGYYNKLKEQSEANNHILEKQQSYIDSMSVYLNQISDASSHFSMTMASQVEALQKMEGDITESAKNNIILLSETAAEAQRELANEASTNQKTLLEKVEQYLVAIQNMETSIQKNSTANTQQIIQKTNEYCDILTNMAKTEAKEISDISNKINSSLSAVSQGLNTASNNFMGSLQSALDQTFDSFDKNLAKITDDLSGTILRVDETTKRVPMVVDNAYKAMYDSFEEVNKELQTLVHSIDQLRRMADAQLDLLKNDN